MTEQQILKKFEELGYEIENHLYHTELKNKNQDKIIYVNYYNKSLCCSSYYGRTVWRTISLKEHQLLHELFKCWSWFDE